MRFGRHYIVLIILALIISGFIAKIIMLQAVDHSNLTSKANKSTTRILNVASHRGIITDRNGEPLAISVPVAAVWCNPREFNIHDPKVAKLVNILGIPKFSLARKIKKYSNKRFVYLKRQLTQDVISNIKNLDLQGIYLKKEYRRYYPGGEANAHILGFTGIDGDGLTGLELQFDSWLRGIAGSKQVAKDAKGNIVNLVATKNRLDSGRDLSLSIDQKLQYAAYSALQEAVRKHDAAAGSAVVLDVNTGAVLAMVNQPSFNPNNRYKNVASENLANRAVTNIFEPGSVMKSLSMASVLESGNVDLNTTVHTSPGVLKVSGVIVRDLNDNGTLDLTGILAKSSNIGITKLVLQNDPGALFNLYTRLGFGETTGSGFPGERGGSILDPRNYKSKHVLAAMSFGYGISTTPLQLARAYAALGSNGILRDVTFLKDTQNIATKQAMQPEIAHKVLNMLTNITNYRSKVAGYRVAGKTGSPRKLGIHGYDDSKHVSVFAGLAPALNPQFSIVVMIDDPQKNGYYGNVVAAPVFSRIAAAALRIFATPLDLIKTQGVQIAAVNSTR